MKQMTEDEKNLFKGKPNGIALIRDCMISAPNLFKMSSKELETWDKKVSSYWNSMDVYSKSSKNSICNEVNRINYFIYTIRKEIIITKEDIIEIIKKKRRIKKNICCRGISLSYDPDSKKEYTIEVRYY